MQGAVGWIGRLGARMPLLALASLLAALTLSAPAGAVLPTDPKVGDQQPLQIIRLSEAIDRLARLPVDIPVMVADTGLDLDHPEFAGRLFSLPAAVAAPCQADYVFPGGCAAAPMVATGAPGWDLIGKAGGCGPAAEVPDADPSDPVGCSSHGTLVSGFLGAAWNNGVGGAGVAPNARFIAIRSCWDGDQCYGHVQPAAFDWAIDRGARVISLSWLGGPNPELNQVIVANPQTLFVTIPSGNGGPYDADPTNPQPCNVTAPNVLCVSTSSPTDGLACGAYGPTSVDIAVPTQNSFTTTNGGGTSNPTGCATSFASPTAAGLATLLFGLVPEATAAQVKASIVAGARPSAAWAGKSVSGGILDALGAVNHFQAQFGLEPGGGDDADGDGVADAVDACPALTGTGANGCPGVAREVSLSFKPRKNKFKGLISPQSPCAATQQVSIRRKKKGPDPLVGTATSAAAGGFALREDVKPGKYYAKVGAVTIPTAGNCAPDRSPLVIVG